MSNREVPVLLGRFFWRDVFHKVSKNFRQNLGEWKKGNKCLWFVFVGLICIQCQNGRCPEINEQLLYFTKKFHIYIYNELN